MIPLLVSHIQRFSLHDGPGVRSTVFVQGCALRCWWCHNPETQRLDAPDARPRTIDDLAAELERDARYWRTSGGGVTVSGGEPLLQADAVAALAERLRGGGHHVAIDTAGAAAPAAVRRLAPHTDLWLWDLKAIDPSVFREATGGDVRQPLANLAWVLAETATPVRVRVPIIRGVSDTPAATALVADWLTRQPRAVAVELLVGHDLGRSSPEPTAVPAPEDVAAATARLRDAGVAVLNLDAPLPQGAGS